MRYMILVKATAESEAGCEPPEEIFAVAQDGVARGAELLGDLRFLPGRSSGQGGSGGTEHQ